MARETELGFKIKRVLSDNDQWKKIVKETEEFYDHLESNPLELNIGNIKHTVAQLQKVRSEYNKINNDANSNRGQIEFANTLYTVLEKAEDKFSNIGVMFKNVNDNTRKYVTGLSNIADHLADTDFGVKFLDVGAQFKELQDRAEDLYDTLKSIGMDTYSNGEFSLWNGSFDKEDLRERIEVLRKLKEVQGDMLAFDSDMRARDFVSGQSVSGLDDFIRRAQTSLELLRKSGLETTEELDRLRKNFEYDMDWSGLWDDDEFQKAKDHIADTEIYERSIQNLKDYIAEREQLLEKLETGYEGTLFTDDEVDDMSSTLRRELNEARDQFKVLQDLKGKNVGIDFTDVVNVLQEIKDAIREIKDAFDPLTQAFANEESAIHAMVTSNVSQLEELINKFKEVHDMVDSLNNKDFNITNLITQKGNVSESVNILKGQAKNLLDVVKQLVESQNEVYKSNNSVYQAAMRQSGGVVGSSLWDLQSFDVIDLTKKITKSGSEAKLLEHISTLEYYKDTVLRIINEINKVAPNTIDTTAILSKLNTVQKAANESMVSSEQDEQAQSDIGTLVDKIKSERNQIEEELKLIRQKIEDTFNFSTIDPDFSNVQTVTDKIYQQFVELKNKIKTLDFTIQTVSVDSSAAESASGIATESNVMKEIADNAEKAAISKEKFVSANQSVKASAEASSIAVQQEVNALDDVAKKVTKSSNGIRANQDVIIDEYRKLYGGRDKVNSNLASMFNKVLDGADIDVSSIKTAFGTKSYKDKDKNVIEYDYVRLIAEGTDALGKATTVTREYEVATGGLIKKMGTFKDVKDTFDVSKEIEVANSKVAELEKRMGTFKINLDAVRQAANNITDEASLDVFTKELDSANQKLKELKATLKSTHSLDPVTNAESMMSNLDAVVGKLDSNIKKFTGVDGFDELELSLITILEKIDAYNKAVDGMSKAQVVQDVNKEISKFNAQLDLVKAKYQENNRVTKLSLDKDNQFSLLSKQKAQWEKNGQLTDELRQKIDSMLDSLSIVANSDELSNWKKQWSIVKNEVMETKYQIEAAQKAQAAIDRADAAVQRKEDEDRAYWDKERQIALDNLITPEKRPELEQLKSYMLQQAEVTKESVEEQYNALMTIVTNRNKALQKLMSASGPNEKQHVQDEYSAWFGAWNNLDKDVVNNFFEDAGNQAILGADKIDKFNDELERSKLLYARSKDQENSRATKESEQAIKKALAEEKALMKEITSEDRLTLDKDKQFALLSKQQAQWGKNGQLTDELRQTINDMLDSLSKVTNSDELAIWKKQWSIVKDEVLATKYEIEAASKAQKATADERKASGVYWDKEFQYSLNNIITPEKRPELEQLKAYMLQQADATESAVTEQYDAIMTIVKNKNNALQKLMSAKGPNDKQYWQDQYSAWYGAWNGLDKDVISNFFADAGNQAILGADKVDKFNDELERSKILANKLKDQDYKEGQKEQDQINKANQNYGVTDFNKLNKFSESMYASIRELQSGKYSVGSALNDLVAEFDAVYTKIEAMRKQFNDNPSAVTPESKAQFQDYVRNADALRLKITDIFKESQKLQNLGDLIAIGDNDVSQIQDLKSEMIAFANSALDGEAKINGFNKEGTEMYVTLNKGAGAVENITVALHQASGHLQAFTTGTSKATNEWEDFKTQAVSGAKSIVGMYVGFQEGVQAVRNGVGYVKEIDLAMTELKKVTDETDESYKQFLKDAGSTSAIIGSTISDFTEATATFARLGYSMEESSRMAETAIIYKNVADGLDSVEESSESIISTMMAFGIKANDTMSIIDRFNAVGNNFAITSAGIGEALQRSASALYSAGNTIDESVALVTAANSVIQNPEQVGTALKTLALRLRGAKTELEEAGLETDNMAESTSTLQAKLNALTHGKVNIMLDANTFKSTTQILREMSEAWEDMTDIERAAALELMGGKRQANILSSVITNFETVEDVIETSMNSSGSAIAENEKWLDSIEGKTYQFTNALQTMWSNMLNSEAIKGFIDFGTDAIQFLDTGSGKVIAFVAALKLAAKFKGFSIKGIAQGLGDTINKITAAQQTLQTLSETTSVGKGYNLTNVNAYAQAVSNLTAKQQANLLASKGLNQEQIRYALTLNQVDDAAMREAMAHVHATSAKQQENAVTAQSIQQKAQELAMSLRTQAATADETRQKELNVVADMLENATSEEAIRNNLQEAVTSGSVSAALAAETTSTLGLTTAKQGLLATTKALMIANPVGFWLTVGTTILSLIPIVSSLVDTFTKSAEEIKQEANEISQAYSDAVSEVNSNLESLGITFDSKSISTLENEFATLAAGVDRYGNNISLTSDEYERYREICEQIVGINPSIANGYDSATEAIGNNAGVLSQLIELQKTQMRLAAEDYVSDENLEILSKDALNDFKDATKEVGNASEDLRGKLASFFSGVVGNQDIDGDMYVNDDQMQYVLEKLGYDAREIQQKINSYWDYSVNDYDIGKFWLDYSDDVKNNINKFGAEYYDELSKIFNNAESEFAAAEAKLEKAQDGLVDTLLVAPVSSKDYDKLTSEGKNFLVDWIKNSEMFKVDGEVDDDVQKMRDTVLDMMDILVSDAKNIEYKGEKFTAQDILGKIYDLDSSMDFSDYKEELKALLEAFWNSLSDAQKKEYGFKKFEDFQIALGFDFVADEEAESEMIKGYARAKNISEDEARKYFDSLPAIVVQRLLQVDWNLVDKDNVDETVKNAENGSFNVTSYKTYSVLAESVESYNDILSQTSEIVVDNTEVTQDYKDSLADLGISEEELADCFDDNNKLIVKNAALLNKLVRQKKKDKTVTVQQAKAYSQLQYKTTISQIGQLVNKMAAEIKATGNVSAATLKNISVLRQQLTTIKQTIQQYALLELSLSDAAQAYSDFEAAKQRDAQLAYGDSMVEMLNVINEGFKTGQVGSEAFQAAVKALVPESVYKDIDDLQDRMQAIHNYVSKNPVFSDYFTIDEGQISITIDNIKAFLQDGLDDGIGANFGTFIGTLEDFDLAPHIQSVEDLADAYGITEAAALAMLTEFEKYDASWGDIITRLTTTELDRNISDATDALERAITAQEEFIKSGQPLYDENGEITSGYKAVVDAVNKARDGLDNATQAAINNAQTYTQVEAILKGMSGEMKYTQAQADALARSLGLIDENGHITINTETGSLELTKEQVDLLNQKLTGLEEPTMLDIQLAYDDIYGQVEELKSYLADPDNYDGTILADLELTDASEAEVQAELDRLTSILGVLELHYNLSPSAEQNDANMEKLANWETNGINIIITGDSSSLDAAVAEANAIEVEDKTADIIVDPTEANANIDSVDNNNIEDKKPVIAMQGVSTALTNIYSIDSALDALPNYKSVTVDVIYRQTGSPPSGGVGVDGNFHVSGDAFAGGTVGAPRNETALMGELGPEILVRDGRWTTVGENGAEFTQVKKGDIIFNHKQSEQLLKNGYVTGRGKAYAGGTAYGFGIIDPIGGIGGGNSGGGNNDGGGNDNYDDVADDIADDAEQVVDFIEMKLEEIEAIIEKTTTKIDNFLDDTTDIQSKDELYDKLVKAEKDKSEAYLKAAQRYNVEAEAALSGVPKQYQEMARNGAIAIEDFIGEDQVEIAEAIQEYRDWAAKADEAENGHLAAIAAISAHRVEQLEDIASDFENIISISQSYSDLLQAEMDFIEESGGRLSESYYEELKQHSQKQLDDMQAERAALQKILDDAVAAGDVVIGSDDWYSMLDTIYEVDKEIVECKTSLEEFQNAINELYWDNFDKLIDEIDNVDSELSNLYDIISDDDKIVDDAGNWTDEGITALGLLAQQMENAQYKSQQYGEAIEKLKKDYAAGLYSTDEYNEHLAELTDGQYDAIKSYEDAKDAIVDLNKARVDAVKEGMQKEIDAYSELIEKKKESLSSDKAAYDFQKQVQESTENIEDIERKIASLKGNTSSSAVAQRKRLEAELLKAREELNDLYYDHSIEKQQEALDKELEGYTQSKEDQMDALDEYLEKEEQVISDSFDLIAENTKTITDTLISISEEYGVTISDTIVTPWLEGTNAIGTYEEQLDTSVSATTANLETLEKQLEKLQAQADKTAESIINATRSTIVEANDGHQTSINGYAKGSKSVEYDQWAIIDELGDELQLVPNESGRLDYIKKGTGILNNTLTEKLIDLVVDPTSMLENSKPVVGAPGITTNNNTFAIDASVGTLLHVEHLDGSNPAEVSKLVDKAWEKKMQTLNNSIKKFTR